MTISKRYSSGLLVLTVLLLFSAYAYSPTIVGAADNDFSDGITVDSTGDGTDANTSDSVCNDGSGNCTLRAAIEESNDEAGTQTIRFNITGTADFTSSGQNGYTIQPQSGLPNITDTIIIDGYSQPGSQANTALAPNPLNGVLLIEIDGSGAGAVDGLIMDADNSTVRGLVINNFSATSKGGVTVGSDNLTVQGSYIGTEPDGITAAGNDGGIIQGIDNSPGALIGGLDPEDRNLMSGNEGTASSPNTGSHNWTYQGNYIGVGKDGLTAVPNTQPSGSGAISLDNSDGHIVGGPQAGAINVISGNTAMGIAPHNADNILLEGNYIGVGYDGITPVANGGSGINISDSVAATIQNNTLSFNGGSGINVNQTNDSNILGNKVSGNTNSGINISNANYNVVGGTSQTERNIINNNSQVQLSIAGTSAPATNNIVQGNYIGVDSNAEIDDSFTQVPGITISGIANNNLVGGESLSQGNIIAGNSVAGVVVNTLNIIGFAILNPNSNTIIGNHILHNEPGTYSILDGVGLGIELSQTNLDGSFVPQSALYGGPTPNDSTDADTGSNNYINYPVINSAEQNVLDLSLNLDLDAADSPTDEYRVEIFANDEADPSGYGEGQTFLGYAELSPGSDQHVNITLPTGTNLSGKVLSATTTAIDSSTNSGFGSTSEFSLVSNVTITALPQVENEANAGVQQNNDALAATGKDIPFVAALSMFISASALAMLMARRYNMFRNLH